MTDKEWNESLIFWLKIIIAISLVAIVLFLTWNLSARLTNNQIHKQTQSQSYSNDARKYESEVCGRLSGAALGQCVAEVKNSTRQNKRDDDDLVAQQEMAEWAKAMTLVSLLSFGLAAFGIWYVRANLEEMKQGRELTQQALDLAKRDRRCWLSIKLQHGHQVKRDDGTYAGFKVRYDVEHFGDTPAFDLKKHVFHFCADDVFSVTDAAKLYGLRSVQDAHKWPPSITPVFNQTTQRGHFSAASFGNPEAPQVSGFDKSYHAVVAVTYKVVGDTEIHYVCGVYKVEHQNGPDAPPSTFVRMSYAAN